MHTFPGMQGVRCISDIRQGIGPVGGLHAGALAAKGDLIFVSACDMPCVDAAIVSYLFEAIGGMMQPSRLWNERMLEPLHAVYRRTALLTYLESHTSLSLRAMIRSPSTPGDIPVDELRAFDPSS